MIQMFHVYKYYQRDIPALDDVNLRVEKGEFVFLTGPSGAGKSTLLRLVFCAEEPSRGQILVNGRNVARLNDSSIPYLRRNIGVVFQDFKLLPDRSIYDNVAFPLEVVGLPGRTIRKRVWEALKKVGLQHKVGSLPPTLSGGEQQRAALARAIVNEPAVLLADEPTGNLDPDLTMEIMELIKGINARGTTVIVATHNPFLVTHYSKRVLALERGKLVKS